MRKIDGMGVACAREGKGKRRRHVRGSVLCALLSPPLLPALSKEAKFQKKEDASARSELGWAVGVRALAELTGSAICHAGFAQMIAPAMHTPMDWIRSPNTCM